MELNQRQARFWMGHQPVGVGDRIQTNRESTMTIEDQVAKIKVLTNTNQLPAGVDLYGVQAKTPEDAQVKLQAAAKRKARRLDTQIFQWGSYFYGQFLPDKS